jgi:hypothetical protein
MKRIPFPFEQDSGAFMHEMMQMLVQELGKRHTEHIPPGNVHAFYHGTGWTYPREGTDGYSMRVGEIRPERVGCAIEVDRIRAHDISLVPDFLRTTVENFMSAFYQRLLSAIDTSTQETGNVFSIPQTGLTEATVLQMISSIELSVAEDGTVPRAELFANDAFRESFEARLREGSPEFLEKVESLWKLKEKEARDREAARIGHYNCEQ